MNTNWAKLASVITLLVVAMVVPQSTRAHEGVTVSGLAYSIINVHQEPTIRTEDTEEHATGTFIVIRIAVRNESDSAVVISASDFLLRHGSATYDPAPASRYLNNAFFLTTINPGASQTGSIAFDVPANTEPSAYKLEVYGNGGMIPRFIGL